MTIFGKRLSDYVDFCKAFLILIPILGIVRLALSLSGEPNSMVKWFSVSVAVWIATLIYSIRVHTKAFGSYKQLLVVCALLNWAAQVVIVGGIILAMVTGTNNIYSAPEYAFGGDGKGWPHLAAHLFIGTTVGSLVPWAFGSLVLLLTKKFAGSDSKVKSFA